MRVGTRTEADGGGPSPGRRGGWRRRWSAALAVSASFGLAALSGFADAPAGLGRPAAAAGPIGLVWVAENDGVIELSSEGGLLLELAVPGEVGAVAVDRERERLWVAAAGAVHAYTFGGALEVSLAVAPAGLPSDVAVHPADGALWLCSGRELLSVSPAGVMFHRRLLSGLCQAIATGDAESPVWVATEGGVTVLDHASGVALAQVPVPGITALAAIEGESGGAWIASVAGLALLGEGGERLAGFGWSGEPPRRLAADGRGGLWAAAGAELLRLDEEGRVAARATPFPRADREAAPVEHLVADPVTGAAWVSDGSRVARVSAAGEVELALGFEPPARVRDLAVYTPEGDDEPAEDGEEVPAPLPVAEPPATLDAEPPTLTVLEPVEGAVVPTDRPALRFAYVDTGAGVDTGTLEVEIDGVPAVLECQMGASEALCAAADALAPGPVELSATIEDLEGNPSAPAVRNFTVAAPPAPTTTLQGLALYEDGSAAEGARVWEQGNPDLYAFAAADGTFALSEVPVEAGAPLAISARLSIGFDMYVGFVSGVAPVPGGITDVGVVELRPECDQFVTAAPFAIDRSVLGNVSAMAVYDEGSGPRIFAAGGFHYGGGGPLDRVARWGPEGWEQVGGGITADFNPSVAALAVYDDGSGPALYAGGAFTIAGGRGAYRLARWDGESWEEVGRGVNDAVTGLAVFDDGGGEALYVAGRFTRVQWRKDWQNNDVSLPIATVARWDGQTWSAVGGGLPAPAPAISLRLSVLSDASGPGLYAWDHNGRQIWQLIAGEWQAIASPDPSITSHLRSLVSADDGSGPALFAAGETLQSGYVKKLVGGSWVTLSSDEVTSMVAYHDGAGSVLFASGTFHSQPDPLAFEVRSWDGSGWSAPLGDGASLFVVEGGGGPPTLVRTPRFARWQGGSWVPYLTGIDTEGSVTSLAFVESPSGTAVLFAGPQRAAGVQLDGGIGRWDGVTVTAAGQGLDGGSKVVQVHDGVRDRVYGLAESSGQVAEWNGSGWTPIGPPIGLTIRDVDWIDVAGSGSRLYAAGDGVFRWNGAFWQPIGGPAGVEAIEGFAGALYVGGEFGYQPGVSGENLARWDGTAWSGVGWVAPYGVDGPVYALKTTGGALQIGGRFNEVYGVSSGSRWSFIAWDGTDWDRGEGSPCGYLRNRFLSAFEPSQPLMATIHALAVFDDGADSRFLIAGDYATQCTSSSGTTNHGMVLPYTHINLGTGAEGPPVQALAVGRWAGSPAVAIGGAFGAVDGVPAGRLAIWHTAPAWGACSPRSEPPRITITSPVARATNQAAVTIAGHVDEPARLSVDGDEVALSADRSFVLPGVALREGGNPYFFEATSPRGPSSSLLFEVIRDSVAPEVTIAAPPAGAAVYSTDLVVDFILDDALSGVDTASLVVEVDGVAQPAAACAVRPDRARCTLAVSPGPRTVTATVRDRAGNLSALAQRSFTVDPTAGTSTQLAGSVVFSGGAPAAGARVRVLGRSGVAAISAADGTFSIPVTGVANGAPWTVVAELAQGSSLLIGVASGVVPVPGATTQAGTIELGPACAPEFSAGLFGTIGAEGTVRALAVYDDGTGPAVYLGGSNLRMEAGLAQSLVRWDGTALSTVPGAPYDLPVYALATFDGGTGPRLYVGGGFLRAGGGMPVAGIASWDGSAWSDVAGGVRGRSFGFALGCFDHVGTVHALRVFDDGTGPALYAGGYFHSAAGISTDRVARWDGASWSGLAPAPPPEDCFDSTRVFALAEYDDGGGPALYAGGSFEDLGGVPALRVARYSGAAWQPLGFGIGGTMVSSLAVYDGGEGPELYAGGLFNKAGNLSSGVLNLARWNGWRWASLDGGLEVSTTGSSTVPVGIQALAVHDDGTGPALYAAGWLTGTAAALYGDSIARWNGRGWSAVGGGLAGQQSGGVALLSHGGDLHAGGDFLRAEGRWVNRIARWDGAGWRSFGTGFDRPVQALAVYDDGTGPALYAGGEFNAFGDVALNHVGRWNGSAFTPVGGGTDGDVHALEVHDDGTGPALYAGGSFAAAGGVPARSVARWAGEAWSPLGAGVGYADGELGTVFALASHDDGGGPALYGGGRFLEAGGLATANLARWRAGQWEGWGAGADDEVRALATATVGGGSQLFAGGEFDTMAGIPASGVARWDGGSWAAVGTLSGIADSLFGWGPDRLVAGGSFATGRMSVFDGTQWSAPAGGLPNNRVLAFEPWDDGTGEALYAAGMFSTAGSSNSQKVAGWTGTGWKALALGLRWDNAYALAGFDAADGRALYIGGDFTFAAMTGSLDVETSFLARWQRPLDCSDRAPAIAFTAPAAGALVNTRRPTLEVSYTDPAGQIDPSSLAFKRGAANLAASCTHGADSATCTPLSDLPEGPVTISATIANQAGNVSAPASIAFTVETAPPVIAITAPPEGAFLDTARPQVVVTYSDAASGVDPPTLSLSRAPPYGIQCTADEAGAVCDATTDVAEGPVEVSATVRDLAGNLSAAAVRHFTVDLAPPTLAITAPADGVTVLTDTPDVEIAYADSGAGIDAATLAVTIDGSPLPCTPAATGATCTPASPLAAGPHDLAASVADYAGKTAQASSTFTVPSDLTAPEILLTAPEDGLLTNQPGQIFTGSVSEPAELTLDGAPVTVAGDLTFSHGPVPLAHGPNRFQLVATDPTGHTAELSVTVISDAVPPSISFLEPAPDALFDPAVTPFRLMVGDNGSGVDPASLALAVGGEPVEADCTLCSPIASCTLAEPPTGAVITVSATVADRAGNGSTTSVRFITDPDADVTPPVIQLLSPPPGATVAEPVQVLQGVVSEPSSLTLDGAPVPVDAGLGFTSDPVTLTEGTNSFQLQAVDAASNVGTLGFTLTLDLDVPDPLVDGLVSVVEDGPARYLVTGADGAVAEFENGLMVVVRNRDQNAAWTFSVTPAGGFSGTILGLPGDRVELSVRDLAAHESAPIERTLGGSVPVPPDPASVAPPHDPSVPAGFCASTTFLWSGANPLQFGTDPAAIDCERVALVRGRVTDRQGMSLAGVRVSVRNRPELGLTLTRSDGLYDLAVEAGAPVTLAFAKAGYLPAQRTIEPAWNEWASVAPVALVEPDSQVTTVDLAAAAPVQTARGSVVTDADGTRQATLLFEQGTTAQAILGDGTAQPLSTLHVRATEYSIAPLGAASLPAELPPSIAYTYAVELSVDEAETLGASRVEFSHDLPLYVEDFVGFPAGERVPAAYLDRETGTWHPSANGRVVEILSEQAGQAVLDVTGGGQPAQQAELDALGVTAAELTELADLYEPGRRLWRVPVGHFTPWAIGWPWLHFPGSIAPAGLPEAGDASELDKPTVSRFAGVIEVDNQILGQALGLVGTPVSLHYRSDRVPGRRAPYVLTIPLTDDNPPASLAGVDVSIDVAGQRITQSFSPQPSQSYELEWDGLDRFNRPTGGRVPWSATVTYVYPGHFSASDSGNPAWGIFGGVRYQTLPTRDGLRVSLESGGRLGNVQALPAYGLGGFSLGIHHVLDLEQGTLYFGDGRRRRLHDSRQQPGLMTRIAGTGGGGDGGDGGPATSAELSAPRGISVMGDGSLLVADSGNCRIRRIDPQGTITTVAGSECATPGEPVLDGGPATSARLLQPRKAIEGPDGAIYIADWGNHRVRRVLADGTIETVAGNGEFGCDGLGGAAANAALELPRDLAFDAEGNLLVLSYYHDGLSPSDCVGVYKIDRRGVMTRLVDRGNPECEEPQCGGVLLQPQGIAVGRDGSLYISETNELVRRPPEGINPEGESWNVAGWPHLYGPNAVTFDGDGEPASSADTRFFGMTGVALGRDGSIYVADHLNARVRQIGPDRIVNTVAGGGTQLPTNEVMATGAVLGGPFGVAVDPSGESVYFTDLYFNQVWRLSPPAITGDVEKIVPSEDGSVLYVFDPAGRHLRTEDSITGEALWSFRYTAYPLAGGGETRLLTEAEDAFGNLLTIERTTDGTPTAVVAPFGQRSELQVNSTTGYLREVRRALEFGSERVDLTIDSEGLLRSVKTPKDQLYGYIYDSEGRLERVSDPEQGELVLGFQSTVLGHKVTLTTAEDRVSSTEVSFLPNREIRQVVTAPTGKQVEVLAKRDGSFEWTYPDDTEVVVTTGADPRLGGRSPIVESRRLVTPEGMLEHVVERQRTVLTAGGDPLAVGSQTDLVRVNGREATSTYTASDRTVRSTSPEGRSGEVEFDEFGRVSEVRGPGVLPVEFAYDEQGRPREVRQGSGQDERKATVAYNADGFVDTVTDPLLRTTRFEYDRVGRVVKTILPDQREVRFEYDLNGNLTKVTPPTRPDHKFEHNDVDQVDLYEPPDLDPETPEVPATTYAYDRDHRLTTITRPDGQVVAVQYDAGGRVDAVVAPSHTIGLSYDADTGKLASIAGPDGTTVAYDYDGPWVEEVAIGGPFTATVQLEPDRPQPGFPATNFWLGKVTLNEDPATEIEIEYDDDGLPTRIEEMDLFFDAASGRWLGSHVDQTGVRVTRNAFAEAERLEAGFFGPPHVSGGQPPHVGSRLLDVTYVRDKTGRITGKTERTRTEPGGTELTRVYEYEYDEDRGWLTEVERDGVVVETYAYDANGNRTSWTTEFGSGTATYDDQDRLLTYGGLTFTYTENGELLTKSDGSQATSYSYDAFSNLRSVTQPDGIEIEYLVDGRNRRIGKKINGVLVQRFVYLGGLAPIAELDENGAVTTQYVYGSGVNVPDYFVRGGVVYRVFTDHLGSVRYVLNAATGEVAQRMEYDSFGRVTLDTNPGFQPFGFAGGLSDRQTGLVRFGARDYDPEIGRWTSKDPIGFAGGLGIYVYGLNDPINHRDLTGLEPCGDNNDFDCQAHVFDEITVSAIGFDSGDYPLRVGQTLESTAELEEAASSGNERAMSMLGIPHSGAEAVGGPVDFLIFTFAGGGLIRSGAGSAVPRGTFRPMARSLGAAGDDLILRKAVNTNLAHAVERGVERGVFSSADEGASALRALSKEITESGTFPAGTLVDTARASRFLVPVGNNGLAVYQLARNGTAKLKTLLIAR